MIAPTAITPAFREPAAQTIRDAIAPHALAADRDPEPFLFPPGLNTADRFHRPADLLSARGRTHARIGKILGGNFARVPGESQG